MGWHYLSNSSAKRIRYYLFMYNKTLDPTMSYDYIQFSNPNQQYSLSVRLNFSKKYSFYCLVDVKMWGLLKNKNISIFLTLNLFTSLEKNTIAV